MQDSNTNDNDGFVPVKHKKNTRRKIGALRRGSIQPAMDVKQPSEPDFPNIQQDENERELDFVEIPDVVNQSSAAAETSLRDLISPLTAASVESENEEVSESESLADKSVRSDTSGGHKKWTSSRNENYVNFNEPLETFTKRELNQRLKMILQKIDSCKFSPEELDPKFCFDSILSVNTKDIMEMEKKDMLWLLYKLQKYRNQNNVAHKVFDGMVLSEDVPSFRRVYTVDSKKSKTVPVCVFNHVNQTKFGVDEDRFEGKETPELLRKILLCVNKKFPNLLYKDESCNPPRYFANAEKHEDGTPDHMYHALKCHLSSRAFNLKRLVQHKEKIEKLEVFQETKKSTNSKSTFKGSIGMSASSNSWASKLKTNDESPKKEKSTVDDVEEQSVDDVEEQSVDDVEEQSVDDSETSEVKIHSESEKCPEPKSLFGFGQIFSKMEDTSVSCWADIFDKIDNE